MACNPANASPFAAPSGAVGWIALIAGVAGIWLVPGLWLSAVMMRTGIGPGRTAGNPDRDDTGLVRPCRSSHSLVCRRGFGSPAAALSA